MSFLTPSDGVNHVLDIIASVLVVAAAPAATLFPILYSRRAWRDSFLGRALMTKAVGICLLVDLSILFMFFGENYPYRYFVRVVVYGTVCVGIWLQFTALCLSGRDRDLTHDDRPENIDDERVPQ